MHAVVALALPAVEPFDLAIPSQVFADPGLPRRLLESTDLPVEVIAARCGPGTAASLRVHLARDAGVTPTAYRAAYQGRLRPADRASFPRPGNRGAGLTAPLLGSQRRSAKTVTGEAAHGERVRGPGQGPPGSPVDSE